MPPPALHAYWNVWVDASGGSAQFLSLGQGIELIDVDKTAQRPTTIWIAQSSTGRIGAW